MSVSLGFLKIWRCLNGYIAKYDSIKHDKTCISPSVCQRCRSPLGHFNFFYIFCLVCGDQTEEEYATWGHTGVLYASSFIGSFRILFLDKTKSSISLCSNVIYVVIPVLGYGYTHVLGIIHCFKHLTIGICWDSSGFFDLVIWSTCHLPGLNSMSQVLSHFL